MKKLTRREMLKTTARVAGALAVAPAAGGWATAASTAAATPGRATVASGWATARPKAACELAFRPYPHPLVGELTWAYLADENGDPFQAPIDIARDGIRIPDALRDRSFSVNARHFVEGFGHVWLEADNGGAFFGADDFGSDSRRNLNFEFARSRVARNRATLERYGHGRAGHRDARHAPRNSDFETETVGLHDLAQQLAEDASRTRGERQAELSDRALLYALRAAEKIELDHARARLARGPRTGPFFFGCETRQYVWAKSVAMVDRFVELFNYATVTHYPYDTWYPVFEPFEEEHRFGIKDEIVGWLKEHDITPAGRPLFWFHPSVMPDWLRAKDFGGLVDYVRRHTEAVVGHYGDDVLHWEVVNEYHDWANEFRHTPDQIEEITRLACETVRAVNPDVTRLVSSCCPFGEYAALGRDAAGDAERPLRSPRKFMADLVEADVPFEVAGVQMYFPERDLSDIVRQLDRFAALGRPLHVTEMGASSGPRREDILTGEMELAGAPYDWHRPWDAELQADWVEAMYTILYSKPYIHSISWYDFADFRAFIPNGGLIEVDGTRKLSFERLEGLLEQWGRLPEKRERDVTGGPR